MATATVSLTSVEYGCEHTNQTHQGPTWDRCPTRRRLDAAAMPPRYVRCQSCNSYRVRLDGALNRDVSYKEDFKNWSAEQKAAFRERHRNKIAEDIAASLSLIVEEGWEAYEMNEFGMDGNFLDKVDMDEKYKN